MAALVWALWKHSLSQGLQGSNFPERWSQEAPKREWGNDPRKGRKAVKSVGLGKLPLTQCGPCEKCELIHARDKEKLLPGSHCSQRGKAREPGCVCPQIPNRQRLRAAGEGGKGLQLINYTYFLWEGTVDLDRQNKLSGKVTALALGSRGAPCSGERAEGSSRMDPTPNPACTTLAELGFQPSQELEREF